MLPQFALHRPESLPDALSLIDDDRVPYWGGTELLLAMKMGLLRPTALVDIKRTPELSTIELAGEEVIIGAGLTHHHVAASPEVREAAPLVAEVESRVGNIRVRAQGSIGGNLCFAEPRSDVAAVLVALDATVELVSSAGSRQLPVSEFILGPYWTAREPDELLVRIRVPAKAIPGVYRKFQTGERPTASVAVVGLQSGDIRVVVGALGDIPYVVDLASLSDLDPDAIVEQIETAPDLAGSARYKRHVTSVLLRRTVAEFERAA